MSEANVNYVELEIPYLHNWLEAFKRHLEMVYDEVIHKPDNFVIEVKSTAPKKSVLIFTLHPGKPCFWNEEGSKFVESKIAEHGEYYAIHWDPSGDVADIKSGTYPIVKAIQESRAATRSFGIPKYEDFLKDMGCNFEV